MKKMIKLNSDNFENALLTLMAYEEVRLQMSTGDFHTHKKEVILVETYPDNIITIDDLHEDLDYRLIYNNNQE